MAIQDSYSEQQSGRAAADCHNNYVWIAHLNGEWTNYSHLIRGSVTEGAKRKVCDLVKAGGPWRRRCGRLRYARTCAFRGRRTGQYPPDRCRWISYR
jgi:hypothetical protein